MKNPKKAFFLTNYKNTHNKYIKQNDAETTKKNANLRDTIVFDGHLMVDWTDIDWTNSDTVTTIHANRTYCVRILRYRNGHRQRFHHHHDVRLRHHFRDSSYCTMSDPMRRHHDNWNLCCLHGTTNHRRLPFLLANICDHREPYYKKKKMETKIVIKKRNSAMPGDNLFA